MLQRTPVAKQNLREQTGALLAAQKKLQALDSLEKAVRPQRSAAVSHARLHAGEYLPAFSTVKAALN